MPLNDNIFHPDTKGLAHELVDAVLRRWIHPSIDFLPEAPGDYEQGFVIRDSFVGTWEVRIKKVK